jgi:thymidylate kinase
MSEQTEISQLVTAVDRAWQEAGIQCGLPRNDRGVAASTAREIYVRMDPAELRPMEQTLLKAAPQAGFRCHNRIESAGLALYLSSRKSNAQVHFDLAADPEGRSFSSRLRGAIRLIKRWFWPPGVTVVLCGADGSGKSTAAQALINGLSCTFPPKNVRQFHWKPPLFSAGRQAARAPTTDPHGRPARRPVLSLCYFGIHWLEFLLGSHLRLRPITSRGGLVLIDRYYYDFFVDQRRYRLAVPLFIIRLGHFFLKKPDVVVLLDAPASVLQSRKQEVPFAETERQRAAYLRLVQSLDNGRVVDATQPPEKVGADITRLILDFMAERTARRYGMPHP